MNFIWQILKNYHYICTAIRRIKHFGLIDCEFNLYDLPFEIENFQIYKIKKL